MGPENRNYSGLRGPGAGVARNERGGLTHSLDGRPVRSEQRRRGPTAFGGVCPGLRRVQAVRGVVARVVDRGADRGGLELALNDAAGRLVGMEPRVLAGGREDDLSADRVKYCAKLCWTPQNVGSRSYRTDRPDAPPVPDDHRC